MDHAITSLSNMCLNPSEKNIFTAVDGFVQSYGQPVQAPGSTKSSDIDSINPEFGKINGKYGILAYGVEWVEFLVIEMKNASDLDDARARASGILESFEKTVMSRSGAISEVLCKENTSLQEQVQNLLQENNILKCAVAIQHECQLEQEENSKEVQQLRKLVSQYQE